MKINTGQFNAEETLREAGLSKTTQRLAVLSILNHADCPLTANEIFLRLGSTRKVNKVTVYRILASYTHKGIIREFESKQGIHYYEMVSPLVPLHPHFICRNCGMMVCMTSFVPNDTWEQMIDQYGFSVENISISGLCGLCKFKKQLVKKR